MNDQKLSIAKALIKDGGLTVKEIAEQIGVSDATLYKHMPHPREAELKT